MPTRIPLNAADLRGAARLATDATRGLADLVEAVHQRIARVPGWPRAQSGAPDGRMGGISGLVYRTVHGVTRLVGGSVDVLLGLLGSSLPAGSSAEREAVLAALNGVLGDHLAATANPLAITMALRHQGRPLLLQRQALLAHWPQPGGKLLVLLHGLCMNDGQWSRDGHNHGLALARDAGYTPVFVHYNSGLHIAGNGRALALLMQQLLAQWPHPVQRLVLLGHSMGGLVARSALRQGQRQRWARQVSDLVCLGTPHQGAPLERAGHWVDLLLGATPYAAPFARLGRVRSAGITDLRHGALLDTDTQHLRLPQTVPLPKRVRCYALAATTGAQAGDAKDRLLGDGLVPLSSALGQHAQPQRALAFAPERCWVGHGINHMGLLSNVQVYAQLLRWLT